MEPPFGRALDGLANVVSNKWFAAMGLVGLILFAVSWVVAIPGDVVIVRCVGLIMMGWGFGIAECRYVQKVRFHDTRLEREAWSLSRSGAVLFAIAIGATVWLVMHVT